MLVMGIDPGFAITGYGIVKYEGNKFSPIEYGAILTKAGEPFDHRLLKRHGSRSQSRYRNIRIHSAAGKAVGGRVWKG
jgi:hypothetical protein